MFAARRAPVALRSLYLASSATSRSIAQPILRTQAKPQFIQDCRIPQLTRFFSSNPSKQYQAAEAANIPEDAGQSEYTRFDELARDNIIHQRIIDNLTKGMGIETMTPVQQMTINHTLDGSDVIAQAKTGTGKTLAFLMPIVQRILRDPDLETKKFRASAGDIRALIISPTRELAEQIAVEAGKVVRGTGVVVQTAVGGTQKSMHLREMQRRGCHILVGTPGRINDIVSDHSTGVNLDNIETLVLDEADRLLDIGFAPAIAEIQTYMPNIREKPRQTLMFSATVPQSVVSLVRQTLRPDFKFIRTIDPNEAPTHERVKQNVVFGKALQNQIPIILEVAHNAIEAHKKDPENNMPFKAIVYFGSTAEVTMAFEAFSKMRDPDSPRSMFSAHPLDPCRIFSIHGKLTQQQRTREASNFRNSQSAILFSSDVTARGMDFPNVSHVIQIGLPRSSDDYIHRIGRTGRAGKSGEGWLILNDDERRDVAQRMRNSGINLQEAKLVTGDLDMTRGAQIPSHIAKLLKYVEVGVKSVPFQVKASTYTALFGVLQQQNVGRSKQTQVDMMNDLAKYGWGMATPPSVPRSLVAKIGFGNVQGLNFEERGPPRDDRGPQRGGFRGDRGDRRSGGFNRDDPFNMGGSGTGVFGGSGGARDQGFSRENDREGAFGSRDDRRGGFGDREGGRGGFGGGRGGSFGSRPSFGGRDNYRDNDRSFGGR